MRPARLLGAAALGYLAGTVPSADAAGRLARRGQLDLRTSGTGNPGAANAMVVLGRRWGYAILAADMAKGAVGSVAGRLVAGDAGAHVGGVASVVGHCYPLWNGFRGGKGVAPSVGQCAVTFPAWSVLDLAVAGAAALPRWQRRTRTATLVSCTAWVLAATAWWRRGWPNLWGPRPSAALPLAAAASSALILYRFATAPPVAPPPPPPGPPPPDGGDREPRRPSPTPPVLYAEAVPG